MNIYAIKPNPSYPKFLTFTRNPNPSYPNKLKKKTKKKSFSN